VPAAGHAVRGRGGGQVERAGGGRAPVHQQRLVVTLGAEDANSPDVLEFAVLEIEPAETQAVLDRAVLGEITRVHRRRGVALGPGLRRAAAFQQHPGQPARRLLPEAVEAAVEHRHVFLLTVDFLGVRNTRRA
jgi:hypothetical protein